jgi:septal ring factor EnvC (AmiA/AmiB activator)
VPQALPLLIAALLGVPPPAAPNPRPNPREELKSVQLQIEREAHDVAVLKAEGGTLLQLLDDAEREESEAVGNAEAAEAGLAALQSELDAARLQRSEARIVADARLAELRPKLRVWQRLSVDRQIGLLLDARSAQQADSRQQLLAKVLGKDLASVKVCLLAVREADRKEAAVTALSEELARREAEAEWARTAAGARRKRHAALLSFIKTERSIHQRALTELEQAQKRLTAVVAALPPERAPGTHFAAAKGRLPPPAAGAIEVGFGEILNPRFNTVTLHKGLDIRAPEGAPVASVHEGLVVHAGWFSGYGNLLIVDHGDGYFSLFAHLASLDVKVGERVARGQRLGAVGRTGSLKGPYLYFEVRHHGEALDPSAWVAWRR